MIMHRRFILLRIIAGFATRQNKSAPPEPPFDYLAALNRTKQEITKRTCITDFQSQAGQQELHNINRQLDRQRYQQQTYREICVVGCM